MLLASCQAVQDDPCGPARHAPIVGGPAAAAALPAGPMIRVVGPGDVVTLDHVPERLNVLTDAAGVIVALDCG